MWPVYHDLRRRDATLLSNDCCIATLVRPGHGNRLPNGGIPTKPRGGFATMTGDPMHEPLVDGVIRKLWIDRAGPYRDHLLRLDADSRRNRFGGAVSDEFIINYIELSLGLDAVIHGFFVDGILRGVAELRPLGNGLVEEAEAAFSIEKPWQSHGVGTALLERTLLA